MMPLLLNCQCHRCCCCYSDCSRIISSSFEYSFLFPFYFDTLDWLFTVHSTRSWLVKVYTHTYIFEVDSIVHRRRQRKNFHLPMHRIKMCLQCTEKSAHTDTQQTTSTWTANKMKNKTAKNNCEENEKQRKQHWKTVCEALNIREKSSNEVGLVHAGCCLVIFLMLTCAFKMLFTSLHLR